MSGVKRLSAALGAAIIALHAVAFAAHDQKRFGSVEDAVTALLSALRDGDKKTVIAIVGSEGRTLVSSGDDVADRQAFARFVTAYDQGHRVEGGGGKVVLYVGADDYPFPIPLVPDGPNWRWDADAGREEILGRRIGRNELDAIQVCLAYVDAQREYYAEDRAGTGLLEYAQRLGSTPGKRDGLFWNTRPGEDPSPLGALVAAARAEGYQPRRSNGPAPYHGYLYRILLAQGPDARGGAYDYVVHGHMIGGFALVAFPAQYAASGVMTFIVNHEGVVYQQDLGPNTTRLASAMKAFNPDRGWQRVEATAR